jgi:hypothetical protein
VTLELPGATSGHAETAWPYRRLGEGAGGVGYPGANAEGDAKDPASLTLTMIPYFAWANREIGPMRVWLPSE